MPPPPTAAPPGGWRLQRLDVPAAPRLLPPQDEAAIARSERGARVFTRTAGIIAALTIAAMVFVLCGQSLG
jgi:hypothetical protein